MEHKTPKASFGFPRKARITRGAELQRIVKEGKRIRTMHLEVRTAASPLARSIDTWKGLRIGLIIPRFKHSAVARNRVKRRLHELARTQILPLAFPIDIVLRIRSEAYDASFDALSKDILRVVEQLREWCVVVGETRPIEQTGTSEPDGTK